MSEQEATSALSALDGHVIEEYLGEGGMGIVYRARQPHTGQSVALKMLQRVDPVGIYRLKREFRALSDILHPNLVRLYELRCVAEQWFFTMELVDGQPFLRHLGVPSWRPTLTPSVASDDTLINCDADPAPGERAAERRGPDAADASSPQPVRAAADWALDTPRLRDSFRQLVLGVDAIHRAGKLHCDIKPSNLLVARDGRVVVLDFGVITACDPSDPFHTQGDHIIGTPEYMSPEQASGKELTPASDWYAVGAVLYEALTGTLPFLGPHLQVMTIKQTSRPMPPSKYRPDLPPDLEALCLDLLAIDPEARPAPSEILGRLAVEPQVHAETSVAAAGASLAPGALFGRDAQLAALHDAWNAVGPSSPVIALVLGQSGIGKTALVQQFLREASSRPDVLVLRGRCYERESVPYKAFDPIVDELSRYLSMLSDREVAEVLPRDIRALGRVFPVLRRVRAVAAARGRRIEGTDRVELRRRMLQACKELFARLADTRKLILAIDDLQWGDLDSARLLLELLEAPDAPSLLMIGSARMQDSERSPMLHELSRPDASHTLGAQIRRIELPELTSEQARALAASLLGEQPDENSAHAIAQESGGNPFFVHELSRHVRSQDEGRREAARLGQREGQRGGQRDAQHAGEQRAAISGDALRFDNVLQRRVDALPAHARNLLELTAVAGRPMPRELLGRIAGGAQISEALWQPLSNEHFVRITGLPGASFVECYHDRVREALIASLPLERTIQCHRLLASALEESGTTDPEALVEHYRGAGELDRARDHVIDSASAATQALAFARAARLYRLALDLGPSGEWQKQQLQRQLADALAHQGHSADAAVVYLEAAEHAQGLAAIELKRLAAQHFLTSGRFDRGLPILREALEAVELDYPRNATTTLARIAWERAKLQLLGLSFRERQDATIPPMELMRVDVCFSAAVGLAMNDIARAVAFSARHLRLALRTGEPSRVARGLAFEMGVAPGAGEAGLRWANRALPVAEELSKRHGSPYHRGLFLLAQGHVAYFEGHWLSAVQWFDRAEASLREAQSGDVQWALLTANVLRAISAVVAGDLPDVALRLPAFLAEARRRSDLHGVALMAYPGVILELARDNVAAARTISREAARASDDGGFHFRDFTALHCELLIDRYQGDHEAAWQRLSAAWPKLEQAKLLVANIVRVSALAERGSAALAAAHGSRRADAFKLAADCAARLMRERLVHAGALGELLTARLSYARGDRAKAIATLTDASRRFGSAGMSLHAVCARRWVGVLMDDATGASLVRDSDAELARRGVVNPRRFAELMAPGFDEAGGAQADAH